VINHLRLRDMLSGWAAFVDVIDKVLSQKMGSVAHQPAQAQYGEGLLGKVGSRMPPTILPNDFPKIFALFLGSRRVEDIGSCPLGACAAVRRSTAKRPQRSIFYGLFAPSPVCAAAKLAKTVLAGATLRFDSFCRADSLLPSPLR
jgi:hypothetical protein